MRDLDLDENLQPTFNGTKDYDVIEGRSAFEQWVRLNAIDRLYAITTTYNNSDIPQKIELEISRIADESDLIESVRDVQVHQEEAGYRINAKFLEADDFELLLQTL